MTARDLAAWAARLSAAGVNSLRQAEVLAYIVAARETSLTEVAKHFDAPAASIYSSIKVLIGLGLVAISDQPAADQRIQPIIPTPAGTALFHPPQPTT